VNLRNGEVYKDGYLLEEREMIHIFVLPNMNIKAINTLSYRPFPSPTSNYK